MGIKSVVDSVQRAAQRPADVDELHRKLAELHARFPGATCMRYLNHVPSIAESAWLAPGSVVVGRVTLHEEASVWPGSVVRADINTIEIGCRSNIQDGAVVHLGDEDATHVAEEVVVGHRAVLHGCRVGAGVVIGINSTVLDKVVIGEGSVIGAGAVVTPGTRVPARSLVLGTPGKVVRALQGADEELHRKLALKYTRLVHNYRMG